MITGVSRGTNSHTMIRTSSFIPLFAALFAPLVAGWGYTRESSGIVRKSVHDFVECDLLIAMIMTLAVSWAITGNRGHRSGCMYHVVNELDDPSIVRTSGEL